MSTNKITVQMRRKLSSVISAKKWSVSTVLGIIQHIASYETGNTLKERQDSREATAADLLRLLEGVTDEEEAICVAENHPSLRQV